VLCNGCCHDVMKERRKMKKRRPTRDVEMESCGLLAVEEGVFVSQNGRVQNPRQLIQTISMVKRQSIKTDETTLVHLCIVLVNMIMWCKRKQPTKQEDSSISSVLASEMRP
jgi:hypothetical protein